MEPKFVTLKSGLVRRVCPYGTNDFGNICGYGGYECGRCKADDLKAASEAKAKASGLPIVMKMVNAGDIECFKFVECHRMAAYAFSDFRNPDEVLHTCEQHIPFPKDSYQLIGDEKEVTQEPGIASNTTANLLQTGRKRFL